MKFLIGISALIATSTLYAKEPEAKRSPASENLSSDGPQTARLRRASPDAPRVRQVATLPKLIPSTRGIGSGYGCP